jgi:molybdate transport system regulatory protein
MNSPSHEKKEALSLQSGPGAHPMSQSRLLSLPDDGPCLDTIELSRLEDSFRAWAEETPRQDTRLSRQRIVLVFLIIRFTGAKLNEVLALDPAKDIDFDSMTIRFKSSDKPGGAEARIVEIPESLVHDIRKVTSDPEFKQSIKNALGVDPGFVRRKFYERAQACGFPKNIGGPEMIRRARAVELMRNSMPLPAVQMMLGHSTPNLTSSYVTFSSDEIHRMTRLYMDREASRKTSARNSFFGKISSIKTGDIQSHIIMTTPGGDNISTVITNDSLERLGIRNGSLVSAEIKAPWVLLQKGDTKPQCSADNILRGIITRITQGIVNSEYAAKIEDGTEMCSIVATEGAKNLGLSVGEPVWILFTCFAVVIHVD